MKIKPGVTVSIIVNIDYQKEIVEIKNSIVHDVKGKRIVVAQTNPHILKTNINKEVYVTYLEKSKEKSVRYGFPAKIIELIKDFEVASQKKTQAIVLLQGGLREPYNLRMFYRHEPPSNSGIDIFVNGNKVSILDISIDGASFSHNNVCPLNTNKEVQVILVIGEKASQIEAKVVRVWQPENEKVKKDLEFVSIRFIDINGQTKKELGKKIWDNERDRHHKVSDQ
jgi:hypothetical protein